MKSNLILIGMPAAGKSAIGERLAARLGRPFLDTDDLMEQREGLSLSQIVARDGLAGFRAIEEATLLELDVADSVIATGGSVIYGAAGMARLGELGTRIFLDVPLPELAARVGDPVVRGMVIEPGQSFADLFRQRVPLYRHYADWVLPAGGRSVDELVAEIVARFPGS